MPLPAQIKVKALDKKHPDLEACYKDLVLYGALCSGGRKLKESAASVLVRKERESEEMWAARQGRFEPDSPLATATTFYAASLFIAEPTVDFGETKDVTVSGALSASQEAFWKHFTEHSDGKSKKLVDSCRDAFTSWAARGRSWTLIDRPVDAGLVTNRADNSRLDLSPYLVDIPSTDVLNWDEDDDGLKTVVVKADRLGPLDIATGERKEIKAWKVYTREEWALYERREDNGKPNDFATLESIGSHALTDKGRVPFVRIDAPENLWLADRAGATTVGYLNADNEISMYLQAAMLIKQYVKTENFEESVKATQKSNNSIVFVDSNGEAGYIEPTAAALGEAQTRLDRKRDAVFRLCHLMPAARGTQSVSDQAQSGVSKEMDWELTDNVKEGFGDLLRQWVTAVVEYVFLARGDESPVVSGIRGFSYVDSDLDEKVKALESVKMQGIQSDTLIEELERDVADAALANKSEEVRTKAKKEIETGGGYLARLKKAQQDAASSMATAFGGT